jgi:two-component system OmpR family response regulator
MSEILVVDDDPDIRAMVVFALEDAGFKLREASDGESALAAIEEKAPDLVVLDLMMPNVDGFGVLRTRRQRALAPQTKFLVLTAKTAERDFVRGWELGADEYLTKPFDPDKLIQKVKDLLRTSNSVLQERRDSELQKAELLERLESAFSRPRARPRS